MAKKTISDWATQAREEEELVRGIRRRELPALTEQLAATCAERTSRNNSLRQMCAHAKDHPQGFAPDAPEWTIEERANWYLGFMTAMGLVLEYIDEATPHRAVRYPR